MVTQVLISLSDLNLDLTTRSINILDRFFLSDRNEHIKQLLGGNLFLSLIGKHALQEITTHPFLYAIKPLFNVGTVVQSTPYEASQDHSWASKLLFSLWLVKDNSCNLIWHFTYVPT